MILLKHCSNLRHIKNPQNQLFFICSENEDFFVLSFMIHFLSKEIITTRKTNKFLVLDQTDF